MSEASFCKSQVEGRWIVVSPGTRFLGVPYPLALDPKQEPCLPGCNELAQLPSGLCSARFQEIRADTEGGKKHRTESAVCLTSYGTSPPTRVCSRKCHFLFQETKVWSPLSSSRVCKIEIMSDIKCFVSWERRRLARQDAGVKKVQRYPNT